MTMLLAWRKWVIHLALVAFLALGALLVRPYLPEIASGVSDGVNHAKRSFGLVVHTVDVVGAMNTPDVALNEAIGDLRGKLVDDIALDSLKARLEAISWVRHADVKRHLPDRVLIRLTERSPFALWQRNGILGLVDEDGVMLTHEDLARWRHLPLLVGEGAPAHAHDILATLHSEPDFTDAVEALVRVGDRRWDVRLRNNIVLRLPPDDGKQKWSQQAAWQRFVDLEKRYSLLSRDIAIIDLRLESRLVVRLTPNGRALGLGEGHSI